MRSPRYLTLHLKPFDEGGTKITRPVAIQRLLRVAGIKYRILCTVLHRGGEVYQGHYTTLIAMKTVAESEFHSIQQQPSSQSVWMLADDDVITRGIPEERAFGLMKRYAYIVVYQAVSGPSGSGGCGGGCKSSKENDPADLPIVKEEEEEASET